MMRISKKTLRGEFQAGLSKPCENCWIDLLNPAKEEIDRVASETGVQEEFLKAALDEDEKPRIERENGSVLVIFRVPWKEEAGENGKLRITTVPLSIVIAGNRIITVCLRENEALKDFYEGRVKLFSTGKRARFLTQIFARTTIHYIRYLNQLEKTVDEIEKALQRSFRNEEIVSLLEIQKSLVYFSNGVMSNGNILEKIMKGSVIRLFDEDRELLEDIMIENKQAIEMVSISSNVLSSTMDAYASIISNNLTMVMKFLTSITIVLMIPTMVASFYGMNVSLPLQGHPFAFVLTLAVSFLLSGILAYVFWRKQWF